MTRRIILTLTASVLLVVVAFVAPLWIFIGEFAVDRAQRQAVLQAQSLVSAVSVAPPAAVAATVDDFVASHPGTGYQVTVYLSDGARVGTDRPADSVVGLAERGGAFFAEAAGGRDLVIPAVDGDGRTVVVRLFVPDELLSRNVTPARLVLLGLGAGLLALAVVVGLLLARSFLRPVRALSTAAAALASGDLGARVAPEGPSELQAVAVQLNRLASRVSELLRGEREEVADLAHRLRTPVSALRLDVEAMRDPDDRERIGADVDRLERMVDDVIREARRPVREGVEASCDAAAVVRDRLEFWRVLAEDQGRSVASSVPDDAVPVRATAADLGDALDALLGNVFSHTPEGASYAVTVTATEPTGALLTVDDEGPGLPSTDVVARGRSESGSTGLGLDIARRTAESSGGRLIVARSPMGGARVRLLLGGPAVGGEADVRSAARGRSRRRGRAATDT
ncbi:MAG: HAMP domain-containing histidine kinase [Actinomycetota bacterium]|nr:MAG: HAMP domain-containing histidine kinase [Actinomycetota bacterium]